MAELAVNVEKEGMKTEINDLKETIKTKDKTIDSLKLKSNDLNQSKQESSQYLE
jgi:hypothetical protein